MGVGVLVGMLGALILRKRLGRGSMTGAVWKVGGEMEDQRCCARPDDLFRTIVQTCSSSRLIRDTSLSPEWWSINHLEPSQTCSSDTFLERDSHCFTLADTSSMSMCNRYIVVPQASRESLPQQCRPIQNISVPFQPSVQQ